MSYIGQSPKAKRIRYVPQAADPVNPSEGDFYVSNGTPRAAGPWVYLSGSWAQVSTSGSLTSVDSISFNPQSADPGTPTAGMVFYSDGTARAEGLWVYNGTDWIQLNNRVTYEEFYFQNFGTVRVATTANITLASQLENGDTIDGVVLATGNIVLVKNQTTSSEDGVYVVAVSGAPSRHAGYNSASALTLANIYVTSGTANKNKVFVQNNTLASLSDTQSWSETLAAMSFTVPPEVTEVEVMAAGGGGGGGGGASAGGGASGGTGAVPVLTRIAVTPGATLTVNLGKGGAGGAGAGAGSDTGRAGTAGSAGSATTITGTLANLGASFTLAAPGGAGGNRGNIFSVANNNGAAIASTFDATYVTPISGAGSGGDHDGTVASTAGSNSIYALGGAAGGGGSGPAGGGGGAGFLAGGAGAARSSGVSAGQQGSFGLLSAGGGGGSGSKRNAGGTCDVGGYGGFGGHGYVKISWS